MAEEILDILASSSRRDKMKEELSRVRGNLGTPGANMRAARMVYEMIRKN